MSTAGSSPSHSPPPPRRVNSAVWISAIGSVLLVCGCCVLPCVIGSLIARRDIAAQKEAAPFQPYLANYVHLAVMAEGQTSSGVLRGKVIPIRREPISVDSNLWYKLPAEMRAADTQELSAVVLVEGFTTNVGHYSKGGGNAYEFGTKIRVVEIPSGQLIAEEVFRGSQVPREFDREQRTDVYGSIVDDQKIVQFLQELGKK